MVPGNGAARGIGDADQRGASIVDAPGGCMAHEAVGGRQFVGVNPQRVASVGSGVGNIGNAGVLGDRRAAVIPKIRAAERVEHAYCSAACSIVASPGNQITGIAPDEATSIDRITALGSAGGLVAGVRQRIRVENPIEKVLVDLIDHAVHVEVSAEIRRRLLSIKLEDKEVSRVQEAIAVQVASAFTTGDEPEWRWWGAILLRRSVAGPPDDGKKQRGQKGH